MHARSCLRECKHCYAIVTWVTYTLVTNSDVRIKGRIGVNDNLLNIVRSRKFKYDMPTDKHVHWSNISCMDCRGVNEERKAQQHQCTRKNMVEAKHATAYVCKFRKIVTESQSCL